MPAIISFLAMRTAARGKSCWIRGLPGWSVPDANANGSPASFRYDYEWRLHVGATITQSIHDT